MVTPAPKLSLPVNLARMAAAAELKVLCPDTYSGNGGLTTLGDWYGIQLLPRDRSIAVVGPPPGGDRLARVAVADGR